MKLDEVERARYLGHRFNAAGLRMEDFLETGYDAIAIHANSTIIAGNQAAADLIGCRLEEMVGMNAWTLFSTSSVPTLREKLAQKSEAPYQVTLRDKNGNTHAVELKGINFDLAGTPARAVMLRKLSG